MKLHRINNQKSTKTNEITNQIKHSLLANSILSQRNSARETLDYELKLCKSIQNDDIGMDMYNHLVTKINLANNSHNMDKILTTCSQVKELAQHYSKLFNNGTVVDLLEYINKVILTKSTYADTLDQIMFTHGGYDLFDYLNDEHDYILKYDQNMKNELIKIPQGQRYFLAPYLYKSKQQQIMDGLYMLITDDSAHTKFEKQEKAVLYITNQVVNQFLINLNLINNHHQLTLMGKELMASHNRILKSLHVDYYPKTPLSKSIDTIFNTLKLCDTNSKYRKIIGMTLIQRLVNIKFYKQICTYTSPNHTVTSLAICPLGYLAIINLLLTSMVQKFNNQPLQLTTNQKQIIQQLEMIDKQANSLYEHE